jgi:hypothetical protein
MIFSTFSRQVLQQGRLTAYLADCGVFDTFDDKRTICMTIDRSYGARLYACLSRSPYKEAFDAIVAEVKGLHPDVDAQVVDYVFQSIRFAWGKLKSVRPPKAPVLFAAPKPKRATRGGGVQRGARGVPPAGARPLRPKAVAQRRGAAAPRRRTKRRVAAPPMPAPMRQQIAAAYRRLMYQQASQRRISQVVMHILVMIYIFAASVSYFSGHSTLAWVMAAMAVLFIVIRIKWL